jgi:2,3-bisphosphoglycerate-independent phosphoglycerate mutase
MTRPATINSSPRILLIFADGVGIGVRNASRNPLFASPPPFLRELLDGNLPSLRNRGYEGSHALFLPLDTRLGVKGLPQSGTGQSALYTGLNTARMIGQHFGPYLYSTLKPVVEQHSIFARLRNTMPGQPLALANAFPQRFFDYLEGPRKRMVAGMYAALTSDIPFRDIRSLKAGTSVSTDITAERWPHIGHPDAPVITPREAGAVLARVADEHAFTLFEYFMTDKAGHEQSFERAKHCLELFDGLLRGVYETVDLRRTLVLVTSDHGNMEELSIKTHTRNPVPLFAFGNRQGFDFRAIHSLTDLVPEICRYVQC